MSERALAGENQRKRRPVAVVVHAGFAVGDLVHVTFPVPVSVIAFATCGEI